MEIVPGANNFKGITIYGINVLLGFKFGNNAAKFYSYWGLNIYC